MMSDKAIGVVSIFILAALLGATAGYAIIVEPTNDSDPMSYTPVDSIDGVNVDYVSGTEEGYSLYSTSSGEHSIRFDKVSEDTVYSISGTFNGTIVFDNENFNFELILNGVEISSMVSTPIEVKAKSFTITSAENTINSISDFRTSDENKKSTIDSTSDLSSRGKGILGINSTQNSGIDSKKSILIKETELNVNTYKSSIVAKENIEITSGKLNIKSHSESGLFIDGDSSTQKISINSTDGETNVTISSFKNGIDTKGDVLIKESSESLLNLTVNTADLSVGQTTKTVYVGYANDNFKFSLKTYDSSDKTSIVNPSGTSTEVKPSLSVSKVYTFDIPIDTEEIKIYAYDKNQIQGQTKDFYAESKKIDLDENNVFLITQCAQGTKIMYKSSKYSGQSHTYESTHCVGIVANKVSFDGGNISIKSTGDSVSSKDVDFINGKITMFSRDTTVKASNVINFNGGNIVLMSVGLNCSSIHAEKGYNYYGGNIFSICGDLDSNENYLEKCNNHDVDDISIMEDFDEISSGEYLGAKVGSDWKVIITVPDSKTGLPPNTSTNTTKLFDDRQLLCMYLYGHSDGEIEEIKNVNETFDLNGIFWK